VTNTDAPAAEVVQRYKSLADIERGFRVLKSDIEIGPVYHRFPSVSAVVNAAPDSNQPDRSYSYPTALIPA
jgi:hypothetical protein